MRKAVKHAHASRTGWRLAACPTTHATPQNVCTVPIWTGTAAPHANVYQIRIWRNFIYQIIFDSNNTK